ncbi:MAG: ABC transporter ATP-binding protein [Rhodospirillales bacterium]|jgi:oligopeptide transport system ATP-binding protein|nr:ABC transporter ATP-binding protein [Rhodospirillales bacterium]
MAATTTPLLSVQDLRVRFSTDEGIADAVDGVSFEVREGETLAVVGESGSGKSVSSLAVMGLVPRPPGEVVGGRVLFRGRDGDVRDLLRLPPRALRRIRGDEIAMVFQEPMSSLNPVYTLGEQIAETVRLHQGKERRAALRVAGEMLALLGIPDPDARLSAYPHQISGGMAQRVMIAMALACRPRLLIADEPSTALDVTIQAQVLDLIARMKREIGMAVLFITHHLGVVAEIADRVAVMYAGRVVEQAPTAALFATPRMPYTQGLLRSVPRLSTGCAAPARLEAIPGEAPSPFRQPAGCSFAPRCAHALPGTCDAAVPAMEACSTDHAVRCARWRALAGVPA